MKSCNYSISTAAKTKMLMELQQAGTGIVFNVKLSFNATAYSSAEFYITVLKMTILSQIMLPE
jgi:hypothetical protein